VLIALQIVAASLLIATSALIVGFVIACDRATSTPLRVVHTSTREKANTLKRAA
jgi:hypothetical protein